MSDESDMEWDLNNPQHAQDYVEHHFPAQDVERAGMTVKQFEKVIKFVISELRLKTPRASLAHWFKREVIDSGVLKTRKSRIDFLQAHAKQRALQFVAKPKPC